MKFDHQQLTCLFCFYIVLLWCCFRGVVFCFLWGGFGCCNVLCWCVVSLFVLSVLYTNWLEFNLIF